MNYELTQVNLARLLAPLDSELLAPFVDAFTLHHHYPCPSAATRKVTTDEDRLCPA